MNTVVIPTHPPREKGLRYALDSLYQQADRIQLMLNGYTQVPKWLAFYKNLDPIIPDKDYGCEAIYLNNANGYVYTCDDDIVYPGNYIERTKDSLDKYALQAVVCYHGKRINRHVVKYYQDAQVYHFRKNVYEDVRVHIPGTGVMAYHTDLIRFDIAHFTQRNLCDIEAGVLLNGMGIPLYCLAHTDSDFVPIDTTESIWEDGLKDDSRQVAIVNSTDWIRL
jgi:hypothetical protein